MSRYKEAIDELDKELIDDALTRSFGNMSMASRLLGINRKTLKEKCQKLGIVVQDYKYQEFEND